MLGILRDGFVIGGVSAFTFNIVLGAAIIAAMILNVIANRVRTRLRSSSA